MEERNKKEKRKENKMRMDEIKIMETLVTGRKPNDRKTDRKPNQIVSI